MGLNEYPCGVCNGYPCECKSEESYDQGPYYLCYNCENLYDENECHAYSEMSFDMFKRKKKCKYFKEMIWDGDW